MAPRPASWRIEIFECSTVEVRWLKIHHDEPTKDHGKYQSFWAKHAWKPILVDVFLNWLLNWLMLYPWTLYIPVLIILLVIDALYQYCIYLLPDLSGTSAQKSSFGSPAIIAATHRWTVYQRRVRPPPNTDIRDQWDDLPRSLGRWSRRRHQHFSSFRLVSPACFLLNPQPQLAAIMMTSLILVCEWEQGYYRTMRIDDGYAGWVCSGWL